MNVLYICYDGLLEPLGQSQVLAYVRLLARTHRFAIVSYEKARDWNDIPRREDLRSTLRGNGIEWYPLRYHKRFSILATTWDVIRGMALCRRLVLRRGIQIVHARSYVASLIALRLKRKFGISYIFDMRGFWPDEKVDAGTWSSRSAIYRLAKWYERKFLLSADAVISLTNTGVEILRNIDYLKARPKEFAVIPTCADLARFHPPSEPRTGPFTFGYVGNTSGWYRFAPVVATFCAIREKRPDARFLIINTGQHEAIRRQLEAKSVPLSNVELIALDFGDVPNAIRRMDATAFFIAPTYSKQASAPTKLAEFLGCGIPCLVNDGVGDMGPIVRDNAVGIVLAQISETGAADATSSLIQLADDPAVRSRCVETAQRHFSLERGVAAYDAIYRRLEEIQL